METILTNSVARKSGKDRAAAGFAILLGLGGLLLALPRAVAELTLLMGHTPPEISANSATLPRHDATVAAALFDQAETLPPGEARPVLAQSTLALRASLAKAPGQAMQWALLAQLAEPGITPLAEAGAAFRLATLTDGFSPGLTPWLTALGLRLWPILTDPQRAALQSLILRQWAWGPGRLTEIALDYHAQLIVADILAVQPDAKAEFLQRYAGMQSRQ
jgi:hypothetical protein